MTLTQRNARTLAAAQAAWDNAAPPDDATDEWTECEDCHDCLPLGLHCPTCDSKGGHFLGEPMSAAEFRQFEKDLQAEAQS